MRTASINLPAAIAPRYHLAFCEWFSLFTLYIWALSPFAPVVNQIALWGLVPISFVLCLLKYPKQLKNKYLIYLLCLYAWYTFLTPIAQHQEAAQHSVIRVWGTFAVCYITTCLGQKRVTFTLACGAWIGLIATMMWYAQTHIAETLDIVHSRLADENLNANSFAYVLLVVIYVIYYLGDNQKGRFRKWWRGALIFMIPLSWYISILAASRQIIVLVIPFAGLLILRRYFRFTMRNAFITLVICFGIGFGYLEWGSKLYERSYLRQRMEIKVSEDSRARLIRESFEIISEHPFTGIGPDQFRFHTWEGVGAHNSFLELLDDTGFIGFIFYFLTLYRFIKINYRRWRTLHSDLFFAMTAYGVAFFVQNFFYIFYIAPQIFSFFFLVASFSDSLWKSLQNINNPTYRQAAESILLLPKSESTNEKQAR